MPPNLDVCRLCAQQKKIKRDLFCENNNILQKVTGCLPLMITLEDSLPKKICIECQRIIEQFHGFKLKCLRAEKKLTRIASGHVPSKSNKALVKEELDDADAEVDGTVNIAVYCPAHEHSYFATVPTTTNVKQERNDDVLTRDSSDKDVDNDAVQVLIDEIVQSTSHYETKKPIAEVVLDLDWSTAVNTENDLSPPAKYDLDFTQLEIKPIVEVTLNDGDDDTIPDAFESVEKASSILVLDESEKLEFSDADLMLKEGELCDIDEEAIEAEIIKKSNPTVRFECNICLKSFKFLKGLRKHRATHEESEGNYVCNFCSESKAAKCEFATMKTLRHHIYNKHLKRDEYLCRNCQLTFRTKSEYNRHKKLSHASELHNCKICSKSFKLRSILNNHMKVHSRVKQYICELCGSDFRWPSSLKYHLEAHSNEKNFLCAECGAKFSSKVSLQEHVNIHTGEKPHKCPMCHQSFSHGSTLRKHEALHRALRHKCSTCGQSFSQQFLLKQHETVHTGARPFACKLCSMTFRTQSNLCNHVKIHGEKRFKCNVCEARFTRSQQLRDHMVRHTGNKHICPAPGCGKTYSQRYPLTKHFRKSHRNLILINKSGGRRKKVMKCELPPVEGIKYAFRYKTDIPIVYCIT